MSVRVLAACWLILAFASSMNAAPFLEGVVTDEQKRPVEGASVTIYDCVGTCLGGVTVLSDANGHYLFELKTFRNWPLLSIEMPGRYEASRQEAGPKLTEPETDVPRRVDFVLGTPAAARVTLTSDVPKGWTQTVTIRPASGGKLHRYEMESMGYETNERNFESIPRNEKMHLVVVQEPQVEPTEDRKEAQERRKKARAERKEFISAPFSLPDPQRYRVHATVVTDDANQRSYIMLDEIFDVLGAQRSRDLVIPDPMFGPPIDDTAREQALALLDRVKTAAAPWNGRIPDAIESFEYDAVDSDGKSTHVVIDKNSPQGPAWSDISRLRGFAYMPPLRWLFSQPENLIILGFETREGRAMISYRLRASRGFAAGLGIGPGWNGFFSAPFSAGSIVIDAETATVLEHRLRNGPLGNEYVETFGNYQRVDDAYAPRSLKISSDRLNFQFKFLVHQDKLWLLDEGSRDENGPALFKIENVAVTLKQ